MRIAALLIVAAVLVAAPATAPASPPLVEVHYPYPTAPLAWPIRLNDGDAGELEVPPPAQGRPGVLLLLAVEAQGLGVLRLLDGDGNELGAIPIAVEPADSVDPVLSLAVDLLTREVWLTFEADPAFPASFVTLATPVSFVAAAGCTTTPPPASPGGCAAR